MYFPSSGLAGDFFKMIGNSGMQDLPKFSSQSFSILSTCHPDLRTLFFEVVRYFDCTIIQGYRNEPEQEKDFEEGRTKLKWPNGKHNRMPSLAADVAPYPIDWTNTRRFYLFAGYVLATAEQLRLQDKITHSVRWGGDWNNTRCLEIQDFNDLPHYELII